MTLKKIRHRSILTAGVALLLLSVSSCRDKSRKEAIAAERDRWEASLKDSLDHFEKQLEEKQHNLPLMREEAGLILGEFTYVENPREVEGYYILTSARNNYPLTSTGITARLTKGESPEVIAALSGGNFSAIRLSVPSGESVESQTVPYDQALNYRAGGLNTVAFTGGSADSLLNFAFSHPDEEMTLTYLNPGEVRKIKIAAKDRKVLESTMRLVKSRKDLRQAEAEIPALSRKIQRLKSRGAE